MAEGLMEAGCEVVIVGSSSTAENVARNIEIRDINVTDLKLTWQIDKN